MELRIGLKEQKKNDSSKWKYSGSTVIEKSEEITSMCSKNYLEWSELPRCTDEIVRIDEKQHMKNGQQV